MSTALIEAMLLSGCQVTDAPSAIRNIALEFDLCDGRDMSPHVYRSYLKNANIDAMLEKLSVEQLPLLLEYVLSDLHTSTASEVMAAMTGIPLLMLECGTIINFVNHEYVGRINTLLPHSPMTSSLVGLKYVPVLDLKGSLDNDEAVNSFGAKLLPIDALCKINDNTHASGTVCEMTMCIGWRVVYIMLWCMICDYVYV